MCFDFPEQNVRNSIPLDVDKALKHLLNYNSVIKKEVYGQKRHFLKGRGKYLVKKGACVNRVIVKRGRIRSALRMAEREGHDRVVSYLKRQGAKR